MRRAALLTVLLFLGQSLVCAHAGLGAAALFGPRAAMAAGTCPEAGTATLPSDAAESPAQRCQRHCAQAARSVPAAASAPGPTSLLSLPVERVSYAPAAQDVAAFPTPERAPPSPPLRILLSSLQV